MESFLQLFEKAGLSFEKVGAREATARCPFHQDGSPSLSVNLTNGLWKCFAAHCGRAGNLAQFQELVGAQEQRLTVDPQEVQRRHAALLVDQEALRYLLNRRISLETIKAFELGLEPGRICIPIKEHGAYVNLRRHAMTPHHPGGKTLSFGQGYGSARIWPQASFASQEVWVCEGEFDCLMLTQLGFAAVTGTAGAGTWKPEWSPLFAGKEVVLCYDNDAAGLQGSAKVASQLKVVAHQVKVIKLDLPSGKDVTDAVVLHGWNRDRFIQLLAETVKEPLETLELTSQVQVAEEVELHRASQSDLVGKRVKIKVMVAGKDLAPYSAPKKVTLACRAGLRICSGCSIGRAGGKLQATIAPEDPALLKLIRCSEEQQRVAIRRPLGIVATCNRFSMHVDEFQNLESLKLLPELDFTPDAQTEYVIRHGYHVGDGIKANQSYEAEGLVTPDPQNQYVTFLLPKMKPVQSSVAAYQPTFETMQRLSIFQPAQHQDPMDRWKDIAADFEGNVTRIYQRPDLIFAVDLVWHSLLSFNFQEHAVSRGWTEGLIVGDTRCGKSDTIKFLLRHYRLGELVTAENTSYAGLVGGLSQANKVWSIQWGKLPLNDGKALAVDELSGLPLEDLERLSGLRSSGIAEITKIQTERTMARVRTLWSSNPRSSRPINTYDGGTQVIKELMGRPEDVARLDFGLIVSADDVPTEITNAPPPQALTHRFTSALCHELLLWTWSRKSDQVVFEPDAVAACLGYAKAFSEKYSTDLPLVVPNEQRIKFARLSAAVAARLFSTTDGETLIVRAQHVDVVANLLTKWYDHASFDYHRHSQQRMRELYLDADAKGEIAEALYPLGYVTCRALLNVQMLSVSDLEDLGGIERFQAKKLLSTLVRNGALIRKTAGYVKTPAFIQYLKQLQPQHLYRKSTIPEQPPLSFLPGDVAKKS